MSRKGQWLAAHCGKRKYRSRWHAWAVILRIWVRNRVIDSLEPYTCTWAPHWSQGRTGAPHIHIGHGRYAPFSWLRRQLHLYVVWPYYRARRRYRRRRKSKQGEPG